jgi:hypothetical protein
VVTAALTATAPGKIKATAALLSKLEPLTVIVVPDSPLKLVGEIVLTTGGGAMPDHPSELYCSVNPNVEL